MQPHELLINGQTIYKKRIISFPDAAVVLVDRNSCATRLSLREKTSYFLYSARRTSERKLGRLSIT
jgi:hypothetical protein